MWLSYDYEEFIRELENSDVETDSTIYIRRQRRSDSSYVPIVEYSFKEQVPGWFSVGFFIAKIKRL